MSRFEVVRTDAGYHSRWVAANGQTVWVTESYKQRRTAVFAIDSIARQFSPTKQAWISFVRIGNVWSTDLRYGSEQHTNYGNAHRIEVRYVDERA